MKRRKRRLSTLKDWMRPGDASKYLAPFHVKPGDRFVILCRVSSGEQGRKRALKTQSKKLRAAVEAAGGVVVEVIDDEDRCVASGCSVFNEHSKRPYWLSIVEDAAHIARRLDAILLAATTDRLIRSSWFRSTSPRGSKARAQDFDLEQLKAATKGVRIMTYLEPNTPLDKCRALLAKWGQEVKQRKGGRPRKLDREPGWRKRRKNELLRAVLEQRRAGVSYRNIAKRVSQKFANPITHVAVRDWILENGAR